MHELNVTGDLIAGATTLPQRHYAQEMLRTYDTVRWFVFRPLPFRQGEFRSLGLRLLKFYKTTFYSSFILASIADRCCRHLLEITVMSVASTTSCTPFSAFRFVRITEGTLKKSRKEPCFSIPKTAILQFLFMCKRRGKKTSSKR